MRRTISRAIRTALSLGLAAGVMLTGSAPDLGAQQTGGGGLADPPDAGLEPSRGTVALEVAIGLLTPLGDLTAAASNGSADGLEPAARLSTGLALAGGATVSLGPRLGVRLRGSWSATDVDLTPGGTGGTGADTQLGEADHLTASLEVVYGFLGRPLAGLLDPYVAAGAGVRRLSFSVDDPALEDATDPMGTLAAGIRTPVGGRFHWTLELRDQISSFEPAGGGAQLQNDLMVTVGFRAGL